MSKNNKYDAGDEAAVQQKKTKTQLARETELEQLKEILATSGGRAFVWRWLSKCKIFQSTTDPDAIHMAMKNARRDVGLEFLAEIYEADKEAFALMQIEALRREDDA